MMVAPDEGTVSSTVDLDLSAGQYVKGIPLGENQFLAVTHFNQLELITRDPELLQPAARRMGYDAEALEEEAEIHELIQRALTGNKKQNVPRYATYIENVVMGKMHGVLPPIHLYSAAKLPVVRSGNVQYSLIRAGQRVLTIDGETQLAAHYRVRRNPSAEVREHHGLYPLAAVIHHGIELRTARQYFHDLNVLAVRPNTSLGLSMDTTDPLMGIVGDLETEIPFLTARVDKQARQLSRRSTKVITIGTLRQMVINVAKGIAGVQYGARPAPLSDIDLSELHDVARDWFTAYFNAFANEVADRDRYLAGAAPVLAAVGAIGNQIFLAPSEQRTHLRNQLLGGLQGVDWAKGERWSGIAGKFTARGAFSVGGTKEVAYAVYNVLSDMGNPGYGRVRGRASS